MIYLDASALVPLVVPALLTTAVARRLAKEAALATSDFGIGEASSAISRLVRTQIATADQGRAMLLQLDELVASRIDVLELNPTDVRLATHFVRRFDPPLKLPDALHLAICKRTAATLLTLDSGMIRAAAVLQVEVAEI